jgi:VCBS repeat-containing protein
LTFSIASGGDGTDELRVGIMNGVTVSGSNVYVDGVLVGTQAGGTSGTDYTISLNSNATPTRVETLFQNLIILGAGDNPTMGVRNLEVTVTDGDGGTSNTATASADLTTVVNDPPVISVDPSPILYLSGTMNVDPNLTVSDVDNTTLQSAQVWFGDGYLRGQDRLLFTDQLGITGSFDFNTGVLTLTGNASVADYETALRSVQYEDFNPTPAEGILYVNFSVSDGTDTSLTDTRVLEIVDNLPPRAGDNFGTVAEGASVVVDLAANDTDADDSLDLTSILITSGPANGSIVVNGDGTVTYTHDGSETLSDTFTYTIKDTDGNVSNEAPVTITVTSVNDAPIATGNTVVALEDVPLVIGVADFNFTDAELDSLASVTITGLNLNGGSLTHTGGTVPVTNGMTITAAQLADLTFTSAFNNSTNSSFTYTVNDADLGISSATMNITVAQVDDAGSFGGDVSATTNEDTGTSGTVTFADTADGFTTPNFSLNTAATNGVATIDAAGNWTYTPTANYNGADSFIVQVTDDDGNVERRYGHRRYRDLCRYGGWFYHVELRAE